MTPYQSLYRYLAEAGQPEWAEQLQAQVEQCLSPGGHGDYERWAEALGRLPEIKAGQVDLNLDCLQIGAADEVTEDVRQQIEQGLRGLMPWRKGPFEIFGVHIDTEWRSDWKWQRVSPHISPLAGRRVLDVGCGSGYHCWRMAGAGAELVLGIDPSKLFPMQYQAVRHFIEEEVPAYVVPLGIEDMPVDLPFFDTVFSMGVLYHRRSPIDHLYELRGCLKPGGELVLETLIIDGDAQTCLVPEGRYAQMRNVWFIPSTAMLENWLQRAGFRNIRMVDVNQTSLDEQRSTDWMRFDSLANFLDPEDINKTIEGYPAPKRAVLIANAP